MDDAAAAFASLYADLPLASGYELSVAATAGAERVTDGLDLTYGDVPFEALRNLLQRAGCAPGGNADLGAFVDLGSGVGRGVMAAALCAPWSRCVGVEILRPLHEAALEPARRFAALRSEGMASHVELVCADLFTVELPAEAAVVFCCCVTWPAALMQRLAAKLAAELKDGAPVLTVGPRLPPLVDSAPGERGAVRFDEVSRSVEALEWGRETFVLHKVARVGELAARRARKKAR